jgi:hypothetical protein
MLPPSGTLKFTHAFHFLPRMWDAISRMLLKDKRESVKKWLLNVADICQHVNFQFSSSLSRNANRGTDKRQFINFVRKEIFH